MWATSCIVAAAVGGLAWSLTSVRGQSGPLNHVSQTFEALRIQTLRQGSWIYRWFGPVGCELASFPVVRRMAGFAELERCLSQRPFRLPWNAGEYLGVKIVESILVAAMTCAASFAIARRPIAAPAIGLCLGISWLVLTRIRVAVAIRARLRRIRSRLPYLLDLLALLLESGATLSEGLAAIADRPNGEPAGQEIAAMLAAVRQGRSLRDALTELRDRLHDREIGEVFSATATALDLGAPLSATLLNLAQQLRLRRVQELETRAARANVNIQFPAFLVLLACLLVVVVCFLLPPLAAWAGST